MDAINLVFKKIDEGLPILEAMSNLPDKLIRDNGPELIRKGADPTMVAERMSPRMLEREVGMLLEAGVSADFLAERMSIRDLQTLKLLQLYGVSRQALIDGLVRTGPEYVLKNLRWLVLNGFGDNVSVSELIEELADDGHGKTLLQTETLGELIFGLPSRELLSHLETLLWVEPRVELILKRLSSIQVAERLDLFFAAGATGEQLKNALDPYEVLTNVSWLILHGAEIRPSELLDRLSGELNSIPDGEIECLLAMGASPLQLASLMSARLLDKSLEMLCAYGLNLSTTMRRLFTTDYIINNIRRFADLRCPLHATPLKQMLYKVSDKKTIWANFTVLLDAGLTVKEILEIAGSPRVMPRNRRLTVKVLLEMVDPQRAPGYYPDSLDIENVAAYPKFTQDEKQLILDYLPANMIVRNLEVLEENDFPVDLDHLAQKLSDAEVEAGLETLLKYGAEIDAIALAERQDFGQHQYSKHLEVLLAQGMDATFLANQVYLSVLVENLDLFLEYGANPNIVTLLLYNHWSVDQEKLLAYGANMWLE